MSERLQKLLALVEEQTEALKVAALDCQALKEERDTARTLAQEAVRQCELAEREKNEIAETLKWERVAFEDRRNRLETTEARLTEVAAQAEAMRVALEAVRSNLAELVDDGYNLGVGQTRVTLALATTRAAIALTGSDALKAHDERLKKQWDEEFRAAWAVEHKEIE